jgi:branched-chain amino acid transport system permease protein
VFNKVVVIQSIISGILMGSVFSLIGIGFSLTWGVMKVINISHAGFAVAGAYIAYWALSLFRIDPVFSLVVSLPILFLLGLAIQRYLFQPITRAREPLIASMVLSFGLAIVLENIMLLAWTPDERVITTSYTSKAIFLGDFILKISSLFGFGLAFLGLAVIYMFLYHTRLGKAVRATWQEPEGAALQGINPRTVSMIAFGIAIASAGAGGVAMAYMYSFNPTAGNLWLMYLFLVVIVGGIGSVVGSAVAGIVVGLIIGLSGAFFSDRWINVILFGVLIVTLFVKPQGLFKR